MHVLESVETGTTTTELPQLQLCVSAVAATGHPPTPTEYSACMLAAAGEPYPKLHLSECNL